jgi:hypothetical protein
MRRSILRRRKRERPSEREEVLVRLEVAEAKRVSDVDRLAAERDDLLQQLSDLAEQRAAALAGEADPEVVARRGEEIKTRIGAVTVEVEELRMAGPALHRRLAEARIAVLGERAAEARSDFFQSLAERHDAERALGDALRIADEHVGELLAARARADERRRAWEAAAREVGDETGLREVEDERDWAAGLERLLGLLGAGPERPFAKAVESAARGEAERARQDGEQIRWAVRRGGGPSALQQLPARLHAEVRSRVEEERERLGRLMAEPADRTREPVAAREVAAGESFPRLG